jgi:hypothetical protein
MSLSYWKELPKPDDAAQTGAGCREVITGHSPKHAVILGLFTMRP